MNVPKQRCVYCLVRRFPAGAAGFDGGVNVCTGIPLPSTLVSSLMRFVPSFRSGATCAGILSVMVTAGTAGAQARSDTVAQRIEPVRVTGSRVPSVVGGAATILIRPDSLPIPLAPSPMLEQVLRQSAFVLARQNSRGEVELSVRGSDSRQATVLVDGLPLTLGWDHRMDPSLFPTTGIDRITVTRGLSTLLAGPNSLGGVIQLELNAPITRPGSAGRSTLRFGAGFDQFAGHVISGTAAVPLVVGNGTVRVRGGASYRQRDGFALSGGSPGDGVTGGAVDPGSATDALLRTNTDLRQVDGFASLRYDHGSGAFVGLTAAANEAERGVAPEQHIASPRFWRYPQQQRQLAIVSAGTGLRRTRLGFGAVEASVGTNRNTLEIETYGSRAFAAVTARELGDEASSIARIQAKHSLPMNAHVRLGGTLNRVRYDETLNAQLASRTAVRYEQQLSSFGAEVEVPVMARFLLSGGVVRDEARTPLSGGRPSLGTLGRMGWRAGATALISDAVRLHASLSQRARFPALRELYSGALNRFDPNPLLTPESLFGYEAGVTVSGGVMERYGLQLQAVGFRHTLDDAVVRITLPDRRFRRINRDEIRSAGFEGLAVWSPPALPGFSLAGDATVQHVRVYDRTITSGASNERRPEHTPELRSTLTATVPLKAGIGASVMARHMGAQFCQHPDLGRLVRLDAQTVTDAAVSRAFPLRRGGLMQRVLASMALENLGNRTVYDQCGLPQPGRTFRLSFEVR